MQRLNARAFSALAASYALGPLATQIVTPAVPFVHRDIGVPMAQAQSLVSVAFCAVAIATLFYGVLSDRYGRRPIVLAGGSLFFAGSVLAMVAPGMDWLLSGRILQAVGGAASLALARTVVHDVYGPQRSTTVLARLTTLMILVPMLAPLLGGTLLDRVGWRAVFAVCSVGGLAALALSVVALPETRPARDRDVRLRWSVASYARLLANRRFRAPAMQFSWIMAAVFVTQAAIPFLVVEVLHGSALEYGAWFVVSCLAYVAGNLFTARWGDRFEPRSLIRISGYGCASVAVGGGVVAYVLEPSTMLLFLPTIALYFFAAVGVAPLQAQAIAAQARHSGAASGMLTALQMAVGALAVQVVGFAHDGTARPMFVGLVACVGAALLSSRRTDRERSMPNGAGVALPPRSAC